MPTLVYIEGKQDLLRKTLSQRLLSLGYDLLLEPGKEFIPKRLFYGQLRHVGSPHTDFYVEGNYVNFHILEQQVVVSCLRAGPATKDFVNFVIWCWGMARGNRLTYNKHMAIVFDRKRQREWQM